MNVCMLAPEFLPVWGGVGTYIVELVKNLPKSTEVHVVTPMRRRLGKEKIATSDYDVSDYFDRNVHVHFVCNATGTFVYNARFQYACLRYVPKLLKEEHIDIIHSHTAQMPNLLLWLKKIEVPTVTTVHTTIKQQMASTVASGMRFRDLGESEKMTLLTYPFLRLAETMYFSMGDYYITPSHWMRNYILNNYPKSKEKNIFVIPHGVDAQRFSPSCRKEHHDSVILFVGRLIAMKGLFNLIRSMHSILNEHPRSLFVFIGAGNIRPYIKELKNLRIPEDNYLFLGYEDRLSLTKYYSEADVYVLPSLCESFSLTLLEAMACSTPAIVGKIGGPTEIVEHNVNGILIEPGSVKDIADAITFLLDNPEIREKMGKEARKRVKEKFRWSTTASKTLLVYERIVKATNY